MATSLTSTTLGAAVAEGDRSVRLASVANAAKGNVLFVDGEAMLVLADPVGLLVDVFRGYDGTVATPHASGALVWANPASYYGSYGPSGAANAVTEQFLPRVVPLLGSIFTIVDGRWTKVVDEGIPVSIPGGSTQSYVLAGAIQLVGGTHSLGTAGALAMTLANPDGNTPEGTILNFVSTTAQAHTVTYTAGFRGGTTSDDVATFGGAIGDGFTIQNIGGVWRVLRVTNVTLG